MNVQDAIRTKRAVRKFRPQALAPDAVTAILNAGRRAQSSKNDQAWHFIAVQDPSALDELSRCGEWAGHLAGAALGVAIVTPDPTARFQTMFDAGQAAAYMQLAAWELGIGSCLASIYDGDRAREILGIPAELQVRIMISFGYPLDAAKLTMAPRKGGRRGFEDVVHIERW
jgi:nitroreductase